MRRPLLYSSRSSASVCGFLLWGLLIVALVISTSQAQGGKCPPPGMDKRLCGTQEDQCQQDSDCVTGRGGGSSDALCCHTGCSKVCVLPQFTVCEQTKTAAERRARSLEPEDAKSVSIPKCNSNGNFEEIQCDNNKCFCVDTNTGFEMPGTRARSLELVNCSRPNKCSNHQCRMLCPLDFELDDLDGCPICQCRDPCRGVKCPGSLQCELEEVSCSNDLFCPPLPTCKQARTLDSLCPVGVPLVIPESGNPYLCGTTAGKPQCPQAFECNVKAGNDYGVCCAANILYEKPGACPIVTSMSSSDEMDETNCGPSCIHDLSCSAHSKCCMTEKCGKRCTEPANTTLCQQQQKIAELLSVREIDGKGYIPQCDQNGDFVSRQCSRNGKVCWCVHPSLGRNLPQSMGPAESVNCSFVHKQRAVATSVEESCDNIICSSTCEFGFKFDRNGCPTCDCVENPCDSFECPAGSQCSLVTNPNCDLPSCMAKPTCLSESLYLNPCDVGTPLTDIGSGQVVTCSEKAATCPSSHICVVVSLNAAGLCCVNRPRVEPTKAGMCPFLSPTLCNGTIGLESKQCTSDEGCEGDMKCCSAGGCAVCADALLLNDATDNKLPSMCQYLNGIEERVGGPLDNFKLAIQKPTCKDNGDFEPVQCSNLGTCWCVDEFGAEIPATRAENQENLTTSFCLEKRRSPNCLEMNCRLGCDYGFETLDGCKICECRNPCKDNYLCGRDQVCEMVDIDCYDGHCPSLPYCVPKSLTKGKCPKGEAFIEPMNNETLTCNPRARMLQCPDAYFCHSLESIHDFGLCCPVLYDTAGDQTLAAEDRQSSVDTNVLHGMEDPDAQSIVINVPNNIPHENPCGYGEPLADPEITDKIITCNPTSTIATCPSSHQCTLSPFGDYAVCCPQRALTDCEKMYEKNKELLSKYKHLNYLPKCDPTNGDWESVQCVEEVGMCWCVNKKGEPIKGTMSNGKPNCNFRQSRGRHFGAVVEEPKICKDNVTVHVCNKSLCENKFCLAHPHASCRVSPCGGCRIVFYDENNEQVDCEADLGKCHRDLQRVINSPASSNLMSIVIKDYPNSDPDALTSSALSENELSELLQTVISTVERKDNNNNGVRTSTQVEPIYGDVNGKKIVGVSTSSVTVVGGNRGQGSSESRRGHIDSIADILDGIMNMRKVTKVSSEEEEEEDILSDLMPSSSQMYGSGLPHLPFNIPSMQFELILPEASHHQGRALSGFEMMEEEALPSNSGISFSIVRPEKTGRCPPAKSFALLHILSGACHDTCNQFYDDCPGHLMCCRGDCGFKCLEPITESPSVAPTPADILSWPELAPKVEEKEPVVMVTTAPQCLENGDYESQQSQGELMWCVDSHGTPFPHTFTRGRVSCTKNGSIIEQQSKGSICPSSEKEPMICIDQCLVASCPAYPQAMCVADPCDECKVSFYKQNGEKVTCEDKCSQPAEPGLCRASFTKYFYNGTSGQCEEFIYGGCQGNENNFHTLKECEAECRKPVDICTLPMKPGLCRASVERWWFNRETQACEQFIYGGCGGNENNFATQEQCETRCPDVILCPQIVDGQLNACSRADACRNITCGSLDPHEYLCKVDPCTCVAIIKDINGNPIDCLTVDTFSPSTPSTTTTTVPSPSDEFVSETVVPVSSLPDNKIESKETQEEESFEEKTQIHFNQQPEFIDQMLKVTMDISSMTTRCDAIRKSFYAQCDERGQFLPTQCHGESKQGEKNCFCVDEAGNQVEGTTPFVRGSQTCPKVRVEKIDVILNFPVSDDTSSVQMGVEMQDLLRKYHANLKENRVEVEVLPQSGSTNLRFILIGDNKVDISYMLEELVKENAIGVTEDKEFIPADLTQSRFHHVLSQSYKIEDANINDNVIPDDGVVSAEVLSVTDSEYNTIFILLTVVAAITAVLFIVGVFLAFQKKKSTGSYPKKPFDSLAFSSQVYEIEKKMPLEYPTFKVTPYVQDFKTTDDYTKA